MDEACPRPTHEAGYPCGGARVEDNCRDTVVGLPTVADLAGTPGVAGGVLPVDLVRLDAGGEVASEQVIECVVEGAEKAQIKQLLLDDKAVDSELLVHLTVELGGRVDESVVEVLAERAVTEDAV